ncbi:conserved hypothetical protein [Verticillium alfalfae VaMs.102]|uniref:Uncharacterized protein n=1 Tax=Verticillium alfalfae (strain VaMs.102 / ATCC MYA-4576 / FGSC 10136) TaxID=526221 RepID=C9SMX5_VERA1|nr:conserved hypothetical protein [Verticillium alfalfae VaMs.102]EEY20140.1 conserved hypothetical protein [Verticillium alfalfae VaMs.102]
MVSSNPVKYDYHPDADAQAAAAAAVGHRSFSALPASPAGVAPHMTASPSDAEARSNYSEINDPYGLGAQIKSESDIGRIPQNSAPQAYSYLHAASCCAPGA